MQGRAIQFRLVTKSAVLFIWVLALRGQYQAAFKLRDSGPSRNVDPSFFSRTTLLRRANIHQNSEPHPFP